MAGKFDVAVIGFVTVIVYVTCAGAELTDEGPLIPTFRTGTCVADGTTAFEGAEGALEPATLTAWTVNV